MNRLYALILSLTLFCTGCLVPAREPTITFHADTGFSSDERTCLESSADQWEEQTSGLVKVDYVYDYKTNDMMSVLKNHANHRMVRWTSKTPFVVSYEAEKTEDPEHPYTLLGMTSPAGGLHNTKLIPTVEVRMIADRNTDPHICKLTMMHELGHVFGINHLGTRSDIMFPAVWPKRTACLKDNDLLVFCYINDCANLAMKPCKDDE